MRTCRMIALIVCAGLVACWRNPAPSPLTPAVMTVPAIIPVPPPVLLYSDNSGAIRDSVRLVVTDQRNFAVYWTRATAGAASPAPLPVIDFNRDMVILVGAGRKTPEEQIRVDSLYQQDQLMPDGSTQSVLVIVVRTVIGCGRFRNPAYPIALVRARRFDGPVRWEEHAERSTCGEPQRNNTHASGHPGLTPAS